MDSGGLHLQDARFCACRLSPASLLPIHPSNRTERKLLSRSCALWGWAPRPAQDFRGAIEGYDRCLRLLSESSDPAEPGVGEMRHKLLCNRAAAWLREDNPREALRDCKSAIEMDGDDPKAHHRGGVASLALDDYGEAIRMLAKSLSLGSKESDAKALLQTSELLARNEETLVELGQSAAGEEVLNALCSCCERLIGVDDDNDCDASEGLEEIVGLVRQNAASKVLFERANLWKAFLFYFTDSYGDEVAALLREIASGPHAVPWPPAVTARLLATLLDASSSDREKERCVDLLQFASSIPAMNSWFLVRPSRHVASLLVGHGEVVVPIHLLCTVMENSSLRATIPASCAEGIVQILLNFCKTPHGADVLAREHIKPIGMLVSMFEDANTLKGAFDELHDPSIPSHFDRISTAEEAEKFLKREKKRMYNSAVIDLKHSILDALKEMVSKKRCLSNEAFIREITPLGKTSIKPSGLLLNLLSLAKQLHSMSPVKSTPVLGQDGTPKEYEKRHFAADFARNPFGDALIDVKDANEETMLHKLVDILIGCCSTRNAAITLCSKNIHSLLRDLSAYATETIVEKTVRLYKCLFLSCQAFVSEILSGEADMVAFTGLMLTGAPELQVGAMNKIIVMLSSCSGDDFAWFTKKGSGLDMCMCLLCHCRSDGESKSFEEYVDSKKSSTSSSKLEVIKLSRSLFLHCLERCRLRSGNKAGVPRGGAWDTFGHSEIIQMEGYLTGKVSHRGSPSEVKSTAISQLGTREGASPPSGRPAALQQGFFGSKKSYRRSSKGKAAAAKKLPSAVQHSGHTEARAEGCGFRESEGMEEGGTVNPCLKCEVLEEETGTLKEEDGVELKVVWDSTPSGDIKKHRTTWANMDQRDKLSWSQSSTEVNAIVKVPKGTKATDVEVVLTPTRLLVKLGWYGRVFDGPLSRRCKASESWWILDGEQIEICIPKDDKHFWRSLFEGGQMKSYYEVLQELVHADEPAQSYEDLPDEAKDLVDELRERQELVSEGLIDPDIFDDFRCVLSDGDGAK